MDSVLLQQFEQLLGPSGVISGGDVGERVAGAWRSDRLLAWALLRPATTEQVASVLRLCHAAHQPVVPQGGLTGLVRGAETRPNDVVLSLERMTAIEAVDAIGRTATVQAGVTLQQVQEEVARHGLSFPLDLGARGSATIGGMVATNAGGNRVIRYGMMRDMVLGLEVVLADGTVLQGLHRLIKNNAGFDLKHLFIGSEGTLGLVTRAVLRLRELPRSENVALVAAPSFEAVSRLLKHADQGLGGQLSAFEVMWGEHYEAVADAPGSPGAPLARGHSHYVLLESLGGHADSDAERFLSMLEEALHQGLVSDAAIAHSAAERRALWAVRDNVGALPRIGPIVTFDISLPIVEMEAYTSTVRNRLRNRLPNAHVSIFGHLGDGNLHIVVLPRADVDEVRGMIEAIVYEPLHAIDGSISAEHGIGLEKKEYLGISRSAEEIAQMRHLKSLLDPRGILNPGKVVDVGETLT